MAAIRNANDEPGSPEPYAGFRGEGGSGRDLKALHAMIGELALENDSISEALGRVGLLRAER